MGLFGRRKKTVLQEAPDDGHQTNEPEKPASKTGLRIWAAHMKRAATTDDELSVKLKFSDPVRNYVAVKMREKVRLQDGGTPSEEIQEKLLGSPIPPEDKKILDEWVDGKMRAELPWDIIERNANTPLDESHDKTNDRTPQKTKPDPTPSRDLNPGAILPPPPPPPTTDRDLMVEVIRCELSGKSSPKGYNELLKSTRADPPPRKRRAN